MSGVVRQLIAVALPFILATPVLQIMVLFFFEIAFDSGIDWIVNLKKKSDYDTKYMPFVKTTIIYIQICSLYTTNSPFIPA